MLASPTRPLEIVLGKLVPYVGLSYLVLAISTLGAGFGFGVWPSGSVLALLAVTLPSTILSGAMFPYQLMPDGVRQLGGVLPLRWYQIALRRITLRGAGIEEVVAPALMLSVIFFVLLVLIRLRMKPRLA